MSSVASPLSHLFYIHSFCHRPASHRVSIPGERERILYSGAPQLFIVWHLLEFLPWPRPQPPTSRRKRIRTAAAQGLPTTHRLFQQTSKQATCIDPPSPCWQYTRLWTYRHLHVLNRLLCYSGHEMRRRERNGVVSRYWILFKFCGSPWADCSSSSSWWPCGWPSFVEI